MHITVQIQQGTLIITSVMKVLFSLLFVCLSVSLSVSKFGQKLPNGFARNFQPRLAMGHCTK